MTPTLTATISLLLALMTKPKEEILCQCWNWVEPVQEFKRSELVMVGLIIRSEPFKAAGNLNSDKRGIKINHRRYLPDTSEYIKHTVLVQQKLKSPSSLPDTIYIIAKPIENCGPIIHSFDLASALGQPNMLRYLFYVDAFQEYKAATKMKGNKIIKTIDKQTHQNVFVAERCRHNQLATEKALAETEQFLPLVDTSGQKQTP
jgi:hypothetical protein